ncbi:retrovirus-related pol polyprotein from transposon TNT 1-94, partial [Tanacetum coccineum]
QQRVVKCFNYQGEGHMARQCPKLKRKRVATWFTDKVLLFEAQGSDDLDAYDSDCDNFSTAKAVLMANLSSYGSNVLSEVVQIVLWYFDSICLKHMTGDRSQLTNFVHKFLGTVKFGNGQIAKIIGYGDYQIGNITISRIYYVEGVGHNLFFVGQFCDSNLEVAFRKHTCFVHNLEGVDLLLGSRETNLYTLSIGDMMTSSPICRLCKAPKTKSWLWHRRLSHLNFGAINHLAKNGLVRGLPKLKFEKEHMCLACAMGKTKKQSHKHKSKDTNQEKLYLLHIDLYGPMHVACINGKKYILVIMDDYSRFTWVKFLASKDDAPDFIIKFLKMIQVRLNMPVRNIRTDNGTEFVNQTLRSYYESVGISHETSVARSLQQNGIVKRRNCTLVEAARTMLIYTKSPLFLWAEGVATASLCYPNNDNADLGKVQAKANIGIFIGYAPKKKAYRIYNRRPGLQSMTPTTSSSGLVPNPIPQEPCIPQPRDDWDHLFQPMFDEYFNPPTIVVSPVPVTAALPDFSSLFEFNQRVSTLEKKLSQLKQADHSAQFLQSAKSHISTIVYDLLSTRIRYATRTALQSYTKEFEKKAQEDRKLYINVVEKSVKDIIKDEVKSQLPQILPKESTYEAAASLTEFELKKILLHKIENSKSYQAAPEHKELYDALVKSYNLDKDLFSSYGNVYSLKKDREDEDKDKDPPAGSNQGLKKWKTSKDVEPPKALNQKNLSQAHPKAPSLSLNHLFKKPKKPLTPDRAWNTTKSIDFRPTHTWISNIAKAREPPRTFNELVSTPIDFSGYVMNHLKIDNLTRDSGHEYPFDLSKPLPLIEVQGRQVVPADYFFNNDLEYLKGGSSRRKYTTSTTKTNAAKYDNIKGIKDIVLTLWSPVKVAYDQYAMWVTHVKVMKWYDYGYLEEIIIRRDDQKLYKFMKGDFPRLNLHDIEDLLLLLLFERRLMRNLEKFIGGREYEEDFRLLERTI